jgi:SAM-dependent methyltransferase
MHYQLPILYVYSALNKTYTVDHCNSSNIKKGSVIMKKFGIVCPILIIISIATNYVAAQSKYIGIFNYTDPTMQGIRYGNWGSRPYEYAWAASVVSVKDKKVIDLGFGLPSQYNWYQYVITKLKPAFYAGVDCDDRIINELMSGPNYEIKHMNMAQLDYPDKSFDVAYCISTFEHIEYETFMQTIKQAHRVLKDNGLLVITLDEEWDKDQPTNYHNGWNTLELSLIEKNLFHRKHRSFGLPEFLDLIEDYFVLYQDDAIIDTDARTIKSNSNNNTIYYNRSNKDARIINSGLPVNSCVSYALLKKKN